MINKISYTPSFTSKVNVVYDDYFDFRREFFSSPEVAEILERIQNDGPDYESVTLIPVRGNRTEQSKIKVQVIRNYPGTPYYNNVIAEANDYTPLPEAIYEAYRQASNFDKKNKNKKPVKDVALMDYMV